MEPSNDGKVELRPSLLSADEQAGEETLQVKGEPTNTNGNLE